MRQILCLKRREIYVKLNTSTSQPVSVAQSCPTLLWLHRLYPTRLFCPWHSLGRNTGVGSHSLLQAIFLPQGLNPGLLNCRQILYHLSHWGSPIIQQGAYTNFVKIQRKQAINSIWVGSSELNPGSESLLSRKAYRWGWGAWGKQGKTSHISKGLEAWKGMECSGCIWWDVHCVSGNSTFCIVR